MAKHEHMSTPRALAHAALIGHIARGTVVEGKSLNEAVSAARNAVGPDSAHFDRHRVMDSYAGRPMMDEAYYPSLGLAGSLDVGTGDLYGPGGAPLVGPAANRAKQQERVDAEDLSWRKFHSVHSPGARIAPP